MSRADRPRKGSHLWVVLPDIHLAAGSPRWEERPYLLCALEVIRRLRPHGVLFLGDMLDAAAFSSHPSSLAEQRAHDFLKDEINQAEMLLEYVSLYSDRIVFVEGNHEARVAREAASCPKLGAVFGLVDPRRLLSRRRDPRRFTWVPYAGGDFRAGRFEIAPDLWAVHGWSHSRHAARAHLDLARDVSIVFGHTHRQDSTTSRLSSSDRVVRAWSPGCLSPLQPTWKHGRPTEWSHGFSLVYVSQRGKWTEITISIDRDECVLPSGLQVKASEVAA